MKRFERKLLCQSALIGAVLTLLVVVAFQSKWLAPLERLLYDQRAKDCQYFSPPPTDRLVHLDIDDRTIADIGTWPWPRWKLAEMIDELRVAGTKAIALDIVFQDAQPQHDKRLAQAIREHGRVLVPVNFETFKRQRDTQVPRRVHEVLVADLELTRAQVLEKLRADGFDKQLLDEQVDDSQFIIARREAMRRRVAREFERGVSDVQTLRKLLLPRANPAVTDSPQFRLLRNQYRRIQALCSLARFSRPVEEHLPSMHPAEANFPPVEVLIRAAAATGFVDFVPDEDGVVRSIPLWVEHENHLYPQLALSLACMMLDVDPRHLALAADHVVVPRPDGTATRIPVNTRYDKHIGRDVNMVMDISWIGPSQRWEALYGFDGAQHLPLVKVWEVRKTRRRMETNNRSCDEAIKAIYELMDPAKLKTLEANPISLDQIKPRVKRIDAALAEAKDWVEIFEQMSKEEFAKYLNELPDEHERQKHRVFLVSARTLLQIRKQNLDLSRQLDEGRLLLRQQLADRAAIIGWTASANLDFKPTSLHSNCPGVVIHGALFNALMTGHTLRRCAPWQSLVIVVLMGVLATLVAARFTPVYALLISLGLGATYWLVNGIILYDYANTIFEIAAPLLVLVLVWSGCSLAKFVVERTERARITRRFSSYVDPVLVNYVIDNPDQARLDGQVRELTVVFTDLAGFTTLSEELKERTVPLLNDYMGRMVPIIRKHNGYVNKFLGDGMMFFYGAPRENQFHAADAVKTVLEMQEIMIPFNEELKRDHLPSVKMRAGVSSGQMVVGDAGSTDASDYTVLGDTVNLGARLELANKITGTLILVNDRTAELIRDVFLLRPIGRLQVVGKSEGVMVFEPLCVCGRANDQHRYLINLTSDVVDAYLAGEFEKCLVAIQVMESALGLHSLTDLYRQQCEHYRTQPVGDGFSGQIVLMEK